MGKGSRNRSAAEQNRIAEEQRRKAEKKKKFREHLTVGILCGVLALAAAGYGAFLAVESAWQKNGTAIRRLTVIESDHCTVNGAMLTFLTYNAYHTFASNNADSLSSYGLDTSVDIKDQTQSGGGTWFDYFLTTATTQAEEYAALYNAAVENDVSLSDAEKADMEDAIAGLTLSDYGTGISETDARDCYQIIYLAQKYYTQLQGELAPTEAEIESSYNENENDYRTCDYFEFTLTESDFADSDTYALWCEKLENAVSPDQFKQIVTDALVTGSGATAEDAATQADAVLQSDQSYTADDAVSEWAFSADRTIYNTFHVAGDGSTTVYMLTSLPQRDEGETVNVRHILFTADTYGDSDAAKAKADEVYAEFLSGEKTVESFSELAARYSEDPGSATSGGLYEGVTEGEMVTAFNDWCFDAARQTGDCDIVQTDYGYHIMYFDGIGLQNWQQQVKETIVSERYTEKLETLKTACNLTINEKNTEKL